MKKIVEPNRLLNVLCLEDDLKDAELMKESIIDRGHQVTMDVAKSEKEFSDFLKGSNYDLILADNSLPQFDALAALKVALSLKPELPFICVSGTVGEEKAIELLKQGASDYVIKDRLERLFFAVQRALKDRELEIKHKQAEEKLRDTFHLSPSIIAKANLKTGFYIDVNHAVTRILGYSVEEFTSTPIIEMVVPDDIHSTKDVILEQQKGTEVTRFENRFYCKDRTIKWIEWNASPADDKGIVIGVGSDITKRKEADLELIKTKELSEVIEKKYRKLFSSVNDAIFSFNPDNFEIIEANKATSDIYGYSHDELVGMSCLLFSAEIESSKAVGKAIKNQPSIKVNERHHKKKDGTDLIIEINNYNIIVNGKHIYYSVCHDHTDIKKKEFELKEREKEFHSLAESMPQIVWTTRADGWNTYFNQQWVDYTGLTLEESYGHGWNIPFHPEDKQGAWDAWQNAVNNNAEYSIESRLRRHDGTYHWWLVRGMPQINDEGEIIKWFGTCTDIGEIKKTELALKESEYQLKERNKELNGIYELGLLAERFSNLEDIYYEFVNNTAPKSMQCPEKTIVLLEIGGKKYCNIKDFNLVENRKKLTAPIIVFGKQTGELIVTIEEDLPFIDSFEQILINNYAGRISKITERIESSIEVEEKRRILIQLNADKDRFISILGHDLKTPFNNILGFSEILTDKIESLSKDKIKDIAKNINKSAQITDNLLEDILMWVRAQQGNISFQPSNISLEDVFRIVIEVTKPSAYSKGISISYSYSDHLNVYADINMLKTILLNLVSNAIKFTNNGGSININSEQNSENATISVSDNGIGIPPENRTKLFDISEVLTTKGTAKEAGTGLGLSLCKEFVEKHGGKIWVKSEVGKGSEFKGSVE